jgi:hypothetical protein
MRAILRKLRKSQPVVSEVQPIPTHFHPVADISRAISLSLI